MDKLKNLGKRIKELRKNKKLTQEQLAEIVGIEQKQICRIENGACFTTFETLDKMASTLDVEIKDLFKFNHLNSKETLIKSLNKMFKNASEEKIQLIYKLVYEILK